MDGTDHTVLVLGANGRFGEAAVRAFAAAGWRVYAQARRALDYAAAAQVTLLDLPLEATTALAAAARGATVVVYAVNPPYTAWATQALPLARHGMQVAERLGARLMLPGNVYNYGAAMPPVLTPDTPEQPSTRKGRLRVALEAELAARAAQGLASTVIRAGDFFGCGNGSWLDIAVIRSLARRKLVYPGPRDVVHEWAYLPDLAQAFVAVAARAGLPPFLRLHYAGHAVTGDEFLDAVEHAALTLGLARTPGLRRAGMPWPMIRLGGVLVPIWREIAEMAYLWRVPHRLDGSALAALVGPLPRTPLDRALVNALDSYRQERLRAAA